MKYIKKFDTHAEYEAAESSLILPNVSFCVDTPNEVHYNPSSPVPPTPVETRVVAKYNVTDTSTPTKIGFQNYISGFSAIEIDGVEQPSVVSAYTFSTTGEHTVKYTLTDPTSIGFYAFRDCTVLTSIDIPNSVTSISSGMCSSCRSLTSIGSVGSGASVEIPSGVTSIGNSAFNGCSGVTSVTIPDSVTSIGDFVFASCSSLTSVTIPNSVTSIGDNAFSYCGNLTSIDIPDSVTSIGNEAFTICSGLTSIGSVGSGASVEIPSGVTRIGTSTFAKCYNLTSIDIPNSVTGIGGGAFYKCSGLTSITVGIETPPSLYQTCDDDDYCWYDNFDNTNNCPIYVPSASVETYKAAKGWSKYANRIQAIP